MKGSIINNKIYINQSYIDKYIYENNLLYEPNNNRVNYLIKNFIREIEETCDMEDNSAQEKKSYGILRLASPDSNQVTCDLRLSHLVVTELEFERPDSEFLQLASPESIAFSLPESSNITNKIKIVLINLDEREDRLKDSTKECHKIGLYNFERFSAIKNAQLINPLK